MPLVTETILLPGGDPARGRVEIDLMTSMAREQPPGYVIGTDSAVSATEVVPIVDGVWSATLTANSLIDPANTVYRVRYLLASSEQPVQPVYLSVPDGAGPYEAQDILTNEPTDLGESITDLLDNSLDELDTAIEDAIELISGTTYVATVDDLAAVEATASAAATTAAAAIPLAQKGAASGVGTLDGDALLEREQVPPVVSIDVASGRYGQIEAGYTGTPSVNHATIQAALDEAAAAAAYVDNNSTPIGHAEVVLPLGWIKVNQPLVIGDNVTLRGQGDRTILMLAGSSNCNLIQSSYWGSATTYNRGIVVKDMRLHGNRANQSIGPLWTYVSADTAVTSTPGATIPVLDTTGFPSSGKVWIGYAQVTYTGKISTGLTGCSIASPSDTVRKGTWVSPVDSQGHLVAIQGSRCHVRIYGTEGANDGIHFQGPDFVASGGLYCPENEVHAGTRIGACNGYGLVSGENATDGMVSNTILGPDNLRGAWLVRAADWQFTKLHPVGTYGATVAPIPQAILVAASDFRGTGIYFDTWPLTLITVDPSVRGWTNANDIDVAQVRAFQCGWGVGGGGQGVLFRGMTGHANVARARFAGMNLFSPFAYGFRNMPFARLVGTQNLASPPGGKIQFTNVADFPPHSDIGGPVQIAGGDSISYTGRQMAHTKLTASAAIGDTSITVGNTSAFDSSGTVTLLAEANGLYTPMAVTYTGKTATTFTGIPSGGAGSITATASATGERGGVAQHFLTGCTGGVSASRADGTHCYVDMAAAVSEMNVSDPTFRSYRVGRFGMLATDSWARTGGSAGGKMMRTTGTLSVAAGASTATAAHNLAEAPTLKVVTPTADTQGRRWYVTVTSTNITVTLDANATTNPITFDWVAEITT